MLRIVVVRFKRVLGMCSPEHRRLDDVMTVVNNRTDGMFRFEAGVDTVRCVVRPDWTEIRGSRVNVPHRVTVTSLIVLSDNRESGDCAGASQE